MVDLSFRKSLHPIVDGRAAQTALQTLVDAYCNNPQQVDWEDIQTALAFALQAFGLPEDYPDQVFKAEHADEPDVEFALAHQVDAVKG